MIGAVGIKAAKKRVVPARRHALGIENGTQYGAVASKARPKGERPKHKTKRETHISDIEARRFTSSNGSQKRMLDPIDALPPHPKKKNKVTREQKEEWKRNVVRHIRSLQKAKEIS